MVGVSLAIAEGVDSVVGAALSALVEHAERAKVAATTSDNPTVMCIFLLSMTASDVRAARTRSLIRRCSTGYIGVFGPGGGSDWTDAEIGRIAASVPPFQSESVSAPNRR